MDLWFFVFVLCLCIHFENKTGYKLVGDVDFAECREVASQITPVCLLPPVI